MRRKKNTVIAAGLSLVLACSVVGCGDGKKMEAEINPEDVYKRQIWNRGTASDGICRKKDPSAKRTKAGRAISSEKTSDRYESPCEQ